MFKLLRLSFLPSPLRRSSLTVKLSLVLLLTALLPMSFTAYFNLKRSLETVEASEHRNLELLAISTANQIDQLFADTQRVAAEVSTNSNVLAFLSSTPEKQASLRPIVQKTLENVARSNPDYAELFLLNTQGIGKASTNPKNIGQNLIFRNYFKQAIQGKPYISEMIVGTTTKRPGIYFSVPVKNINGKIIGVAVVKLKGETVWTIVEQLPIGSKSSAFLIDEYGVIISDSDRSLLYHSLTSLPKEILSQSVFIKRFSSIGIVEIENLNLPDLAKVMVKATQPGHGSYYFPKQSRQIIGFAPLTKKRWVIGVNESAEKFAAPLNSLTEKNYLNLLVVGAITVIFALILAHSIVKPIRALIKAAQSLEQGDFKAARVEIYSNDEVGMLSRTFNMMVSGLQERERERDIFGRVVSPEVREKLLSGNLELGGETLWVAILFADIRGFSAIAEKNSPTEVVALLNEYLQEMTEAIRSQNGYINNFLGDAIVAVFGVPVPMLDAEWHAVAAALSMRERLKSLNQRRIGRGEEPIENGIGITTGEVVAGQIGSLERMSYTVIGDVVNVAARLEALTKDYPNYPILINAQTADALKYRQEISLTCLGLIKVKGRMQPVDVYGVSDRRTLVS